MLITKRDFSSEPENAVHIFRCEYDIATYARDSYNELGISFGDKLSNSIITRQPEFFCETVN